MANLAGPGNQEKRKLLQPEGFVCFKKYVFIAVKLSCYLVKGPVTPLRPYGMPIGEVLTEIGAKASPRKKIKRGLWFNFTKNSDSD